MKYDLRSAKLLYETAEKMDLKPKWLNDYGLFVIEVNGKKIYFFHSYNTLNSQLGMQLARHKHLTRNIVESNSLPNIPYIRAKTKEEVKQFISEHKIIIVKPVFGFRAENVRIIDSNEQIENINLENYLFEKFIDGTEMRYLIFNGEVLAVHEKSNTGRITNHETVKRISYLKDKWNKELIDISLKITRLMDLKFAAVDFIIDKNSKPFILEINSAPGLYRFQNPDEGPSIDIASIFIEATINEFEKI